MPYTFFMALPPTVPTSFVPRQTTSPRARGRLDLGGAFAFVSYGAFFVVLLAALGVFGYAWLLKTEKAAKDTELANQEASIDEATVRSLIALRDRLAAGQKLLNSHVGVTTLFTLLEKLTITSVRITTLDLTVLDDGAARLSLNGSAKNFNALAAESSLFGAEPFLNDAIFSNIRLQPAGVVNFTLNTKIDPKLIGYVAPLAAATTDTAPAATSTTSTP